MYPSSKLTKVQKMCLAAVLTALTLVITIFIQIPFNGGYLNFSDSLILFAAMFIDPITGGVVGLLAGGISDLVSGYMMYAPFTAVIKFLEGFLCGILCKKLKGHLRYLCLFISVFLMATLYIIPDSILFNNTIGIIFLNYGFNMIQGIVNMIIASVLYGLMEEKKLYL